MPRLSYPGGRKAAATTIKKDPEEVLEDLTPENENQEDEVVVAEDPSVALKARIAELEKTEAEYKRRADTERQRAEQLARREQEQSAEVSKLKEQTVNSQAEAIEAALAAASSEAESAQRDIESAMLLNDSKAQADAYRKLARAESRILQLEQGKEAIERQLKEPKVEPQVQQQQPQIPATAQRWLSDHPEYLNDARKNAKLQAVHWDVIDEGYREFSPEYFEKVEELLGMRKLAAKPVEDEDVDDEPVREKSSRAIYSAPPSREAPSMDGGKRDTRVTLTASQKEAARIAGIPEAEYAKQLLKLRQEKANGNYGGAP